MRVPSLAAGLALLCGCAPELRATPSASLPEPIEDLTPRSIDTLGGGFALADRWAAAGHPFNEWVRSSQGAQFARTLCPKHADPHGDPQGCPRRGRRQDYDWYVHAVDERPAFATALLQRRDPQLTEIAIANVDERWGDAAALLLARALDADHRLWQTALEVMATELDAEGSPRERALPVVHEAWRHGQTHTDARGDVLYVMALTEYRSRVDWEHLHAVPWDRFPEWFGSTLTREDFRAYLDHGRRAEEMIARVCPALGKDWPLAPLALPRIRLELSTDVDGWQPALATSAEGCMCDRAEVDGLAALSETLRAVSAEHPGWQDGDLAQRFTEDRRRCKVRS